MINIYPGKGLNRDRSYLGFGLLEPVTIFDSLERFIQISGLEPVLAASGLAPSRVLGNEPRPILVGAASTTGLAGRRGGRLSGRSKSPLSGTEPRTHQSPSGARPVPPVTEPNTQLSGNEAADLEGNEYDETLEGKERGWPKET